MREGYAEERARDSLVGLGGRSPNQQSVRLQKPESQIRKSCEANRVSESRASIRFHESHTQADGVLT